MRPRACRPCHRVMSHDPRVPCDVDRCPRRLCLNGSGEPSIVCRETWDGPLSVDALDTSDIASASCRSGRSTKATWPRTRVARHARHERHDTAGMSPECPCRATCSSAMSPRALDKGYMHRRSCRPSRWRRPMRSTPSRRPSRSLERQSRATMSPRSLVTSDIAAKACRTARASEATFIGEKNSPTHESSAP
jgi:hypothetical protein